MRRLVLFLSLLVSGCNFYIPERPTGAPTFSVDGVDIYNDSLILDSYNLPKQIDFFFHKSVEFWGGSMVDLNGYAIHIVDGDVACGLRSGPIGCTNPLDKVIEISDANFVCPGSLPIPHEIGHVIYFDPTHINPKFREMENLYWDISASNLDIDWNKCDWQHFDGINHYPFKDWDSQIGF